MTLVADVHKFLLCFLTLLQFAITGNHGHSGVKFKSKIIWLLIFAGQQRSTPADTNLKLNALMKELIMTAKRFSPFKNEEDTLQVGSLTIMNRLDRISLSGCLDITLDREGLDTARVLLEVLSLVMHEMVHTDLPDAIVTALDTEKNPCRY